MNVNTIFIHCNERSGNQYPRVTANHEPGYAVLSITTQEDSLDKITFFMSESDLINFKNSVVSAVDNYKRNKK